MNKRSYSIPKPVLAILPTAVLSLGMGMLALLRQGVLYSKSDLGIHALLQPGAAAWGALLASTAGYFALYLLSERGMNYFRLAFSNSNHRLLLFLGSSVLGIIPKAYYLIDIQPIAFVLLGFTYLLLFDLYLDYRNNSLTWAIIWTLFYAIVGTVFFQKYTLEKDRLHVYKYAVEMLTKGVPEETYTGNRIYVRVLAQKSDVATDQRMAYRDASGHTTYRGYLVSPSLAKQVELLRHTANIRQQDTSSIVKEGLSGVVNGRIVAYIESYSGEAVLVDYPTAGYNQVLPYFAIQFLVLFIFSALLSWIRNYVKWIPDTIPLPFYWGNQFRNRLQRLVFGVVMGSLIFFTLLAIPFFRIYAEREARNEIIQQALLVASRLDTLSIAGFSSLQTDSFLQIQSTHIGFDLDLYSSSGKLRGSSQRGVFKKNGRPQQLSGTLLQTLRQVNRTPSIQREHVNNLPIQVLYLPIQAKEHREGLILSIPFSTTNALLSDGLRSFISAMLMVSVFLLLVSGGIAMLFANQLSEPLAEISRHLRNFQIGDSKPLFWKTSEDEIGELVTAYNAALVVIENSTEQLRQSEREKAWREMAKQVAHEIKNPLTPMKLSIQYLVYAFQQEPASIHTLLPKAAETLSEQIDVLARIATEFSNFAQMPQADNHPMELKEVLLHSVNLFRQQLSHPAALETSLPDEDVWVYADSRQLLRVFNNLLQNALQAIPPEKSPVIKIQLVRENEEVCLRFQDNGTGIPESIHNKVFSPNFTTKSSGMGLGLAICRNIIQQAEGQIYFETTANEGTTFFIRLPLYQR